MATPVSRPFGQNRPMILVAYPDFDMAFLVNYLLKGESNNTFSLTNT